MIIFLYVLFTAMVGYYANKKGRDWVRAIIVSFLLSPLIGFLIVVLLEDKKNEQLLESGKLKKCTSCAELVFFEAKKCKHCGELI